MGRGGEDASYRGNFDFSGLVVTARELRKNGTPAESVFWELVRDHRFMDLKFRRQHQIGDYIVDFYCAEEKLIIELDGKVHESEKRKKTDHKRDAYLQKLGNKILRITNDGLLTSTELTLNIIKDFLHPLPLGEGRVRGTESRANEILFIDARNEGHLINRRTKELTPEDIQKITDTYRAWRSQAPSYNSSQREEKKSCSIQEPSPSGRGQGEGVLYEDVKGFCNSASIERVKELDYVLTPGRYVGLPDDEDDFDFNERFTGLKKEFEAQLKEEEKLNALILENLKKVKLV
jgi:very-short-patch-repair endonuclease